MKHFLDNLDSSDTIVFALFLIIAVAVIFIVGIINFFTSLDLYLLKDNAQAVALYLGKGK